MYWATKGTDRLPFPSFNNPKGYSDSMNSLKSKNVPQIFGNWKMEGHFYCVALRIQICPKKGISEESRPLPSQSYPHVIGFQGKSPIPRTYLDP